MPASDKLIISIRDYLGIDPKQIPAITAFVETTAPLRPGKTVYAAHEMPRWATMLHRIAESVAASSGMSVVIAEISVLTDTVTQSPYSGDSHFTTNIVCQSESVLKAYLDAIATISSSGTTMKTPEFHALHCVYISTDGSVVISDPDSIISYRANVPATPLSSEYRKKNSKINFERHHRDFFEQFIERCPKTKRSGATRKGRRLHYMAVPFQRPEHLRSSTDAESPAKLEPAGAFYLILQTSRDHKSYAGQIDIMAAKLQYICALSYLKASYLLADRSTMAAAASEAVLIAYDGIGHALRAFVEATGYEGAIALVSKIQHDNRLPPDLVRPLAHVGRSLAFFEHAEALGSLMRLHGWLKSDEVGLKKVISCFDETEVQCILEGRISSNDIAAAASHVIRSLAVALAYKYEITFRIQHKAEQPPAMRSMLIPPDFELSSEITATPTVLSLKTDRDDRAVLLAVSVALLEPLRNAATHLGGSSPDAEVAVLVEGHADGAVKVYVGNEWHGGGLEKVDLASLSTGIRLVSGLLSDCHLGKFFKAETREVALEFPSIDPEKYQDHVWIGMEITPLALYNFVRHLLKAYEPQIISEDTKTKSSSN
jgi:hypothetical protein